MESQPDPAVTNRGTEALEGIPPQLQVWWKTAKFRDDLRALVGTETADLAKLADRGISSGTPVDAQLFDAGLEQSDHWRGLVQTAYTLARFAQERDLTASRLVFLLTALSEQGAEGGDAGIAKALKEKRDLIIGLLSPRAPDPDELRQSLELVGLPVLLDGSQFYLDFRVADIPGEETRLAPVLIARLTFDESVQAANSRSVIFQIPWETLERLIIELDRAKTLRERAVKTLERHLL